MRSPQAGTARSGRRAPPVAQAPQPLAEGFLLPGYRIEGLLGQGRFGFSYLATDLDLGVTVAIQEYLPHEIAFRSADGSVGPNASRHRERYQRGLACFLKDASALAGLRHPAIVRVLRFFEAQRTAYLVLEHEKGLPLKQWWPQHQAAGEAALVPLLRPLCDGLAVVHAAGLLHRDLRPETIHVRPDGLPVLRDFGSASLALAVALDSAAVSSPGYAAPELRTEGPAGPPTDLYALAATLYWCVAGRRPPEAERRLADPRAHVRAVEAGRGRFGEAFLQAIDRGLALDTARRPHDVLEFRRELLADHPAPAGPAAATLAPRDTVFAGAEPPAESAVPVRRRVGGWAPAAWPLAAKTVLLVLAAVLLPLAAAAAWQLHAASSTLAAAHDQRLQAQAQGAAARVGQWLAAQREQLRALATDQDVVLFFVAPPDDAARQVLRDALARLQAAHPQWALVALAGPDGTVQLASDPALEGRDLRAWPEVPAALAGRARLGGAGEPSFAEPVAGDDGRVLGALVVGLRPGTLAGLLAPWRTEAGARPFLVDRDGLVLAPPLPDWVARSLQPLPAARLAERQADPRGGRDTIASLDLPALAAALTGAREAGAVSFRMPADGALQRAGFAPVPGQDWVAAVAEADAALQAPLAALWRPLAWGLPVVALLFGVLAWRFGRGLARPVRQLTGAAAALTAGDLHNATVPVQRRDELGQLARTFNTMVDVVRQREREREDRGG